MTTWHDARDRQVYLLDRAGRATQVDELREWFEVTALDLCAGRRVRDLDKVLLAACRVVEEVGR